MKKIIRLVSVQMWAVLGSMLSIGGKRDKKPKTLYVGIALFVICMGGIAFFYFYMMGSGLKMFNSIDILPPLVMAVTSVIVLMTTVFKVKGTIFGFRDYDMVMSLPVSTGEIVASRVILLYNINLTFVLMLMIPMMIAYGILADPEISFYVIGAMSIFFIPMVPIVLASVLGTIITYASTKFRRSNTVSIIISFVVLIAFMALSFTINDSGEELVNMSRMLTEKVNSIYPLAAMYSSAVCKSDIVAFLLFAGISLVAFFLYSAVIGKIFKKVNSDVTVGRFMANYKMGEIKTSSPLKALYIKELRRFFSSSIYVLNTGFGIVLLTLGSIALLFIDFERIVGGAEAAEMLKQYVPMFVSFCIITSGTSSASISLEGKNLWIIKSLPVTTKTIFLSKVLVNLTVTAPAVLDSILISILLQLGLLEGVILFLVSAVCSLFISLLGLWVNLRFPVLDWTTEIIVVKQSASTIIVLFAGMAAVALQFAALLLLGSMGQAYFIYLCLMLLIDFALYQSLMKNGAKRFRSIG